MKQKLLPSSHEELEDLCSSVMMRVSSRFVASYWWISSWNCFQCCRLPTKSSDSVKIWSKLSEILSAKILKKFKWSKVFSLEVGKIKKILKMSESLERLSTSLRKNKISYQQHWLLLMLCFNRIAWFVFLYHMGLSHLDKWFCVNTFSAQK